MWYDKITNYSETEMICDTHLHSKYSFDGHDSVDDVCKAAIDKGLASVVFTDHCDIDCEIAGIYAPLRWNEAKADILAAKEKYKGQIEIGLGIELGEPYNAPEASAEILARGYDLVLGSVHNLKDVPDFCYMNYEKMPVGMLDDLVDRYTDDLIKLASYDEIDIVTHPTYPSRYMRRQGVDYDMMKFRDKYEAFFRLLIENGKALEYNVSGIRRGELPSPTADFLKMYRDMGGELIAVGSDAHYAKDVGSDVAGAYALLSDLGFKYVTAFIGGKKSQVRI